MTPTSSAAAASPKQLEVAVQTVLSAAVADAHTALTTIDKMCDNVIQHPQEPKYRRVRVYIEAHPAVPLMLSQVQCKWLVFHTGEEKQRNRPTQGDERARRAWSGGYGCTSQRCACSFSMRYGPMSLNGVSIGRTRRIACMLSASPRLVAMTWSWKPQRLVGRSSYRRVLRLPTTSITVAYYYG